MMNWQKIKIQLAPYVDVLRFVVVLLLGNVLWKWIVRGDEAGNYITCLGYDVTYFFSVVSAHVAKMTYFLVHVVEESVQLVYGHIIRFPNESSVSVVWGCSAVKQGTLFTLIMLFARGKWLHKFWFIPLGWVAVYAFNILRIAIISLLIQHHPDWFDFLHSYLFKYLFYGMIFALWVWWIEKINPSLTTSQEQK